MRRLGKMMVRVSSACVVVSLLLGGRVQAGKFPRISPSGVQVSPITSTPHTKLNTASPARQALAPQADLAIPYLSEVSPTSVPGSPAWVEIALQSSTSYLPVALNTTIGVAQTPAGAGTTAAAAVPGVALNGWQVSDEDGNNYTIPAALPLMPANAILVVVF